jgi:hypothetical protein
MLTLEIIQLFSDQIVRIAKLSSTHVHTSLLILVCPDRYNHAFTFSLYKPIIMSTLKSVPFQHE